MPRRSTRPTSTATRTWTSCRRPRPSTSRTSDLAWYRNDGTATPSFTKKQILNRGSGRRAVVALDLDGDGDVDVLDASSGQDTVSWYENQDAYNWGRDTSTSEPRG